MSNTIQSQAHKLNTTWTMLKLTYGIVPIIAGIDKFFNLLTHWSTYLNPTLSTMIPVSSTHLMYAAGVIEIIAGIIVLSRFTRFGAYLVSAWLICVALNLVAMGKFYDIAVRDIVIAIGAVALAQLTVIRKNLK